ncbi:hypothetical protein METHB2_400007 [Candidatus Methylobacter favarea]|uniref:Uncharacterized protein n=1 Tax=Candidatus Methylobacter favarea TaxID=2707345 RepID=A0A8S0Y6H9_9GAMM|nr:hypothetical protein [Candidatus Methylobacter favarea]CAA9891425.1 hypothetical protein METHB2_400007 [Candidatus Methylobacter favarea]
MSIIGIKGVFVFTKLLGGIGLAAVTFSTVLILFSILTLVYFLYRFVWIFSAEGTNLRMERKFRRYMEKLSQQELIHRITLSRTVDQENIKHLVTLVNQEINLRKVHIDPTIVPEIQNLLNSCRYAQDFNKALRIYKIVIDTDIALLNSTLRELLDETIKLRWLIIELSYALSIFS